MFRWFFIALMVLPVMAQSEWSGQISLEGFGFREDGLSDRQDRFAASLAFQPEFYLPLGAASSVTFEPFFRLDSGDDERSHWDIRELTWERAARHWELRAGIRKVFWGVAESAHLVDIVNQTDLVENLDGEEKLGQPMVNLAWISNWGTIDILALTGFRERTFPGENGRFRAPFVVDNERASYQSSGERERIDWALRYAHSFGPIDLGASYFLGTSREPELIPELIESEQVVLRPHYPKIKQVGLDVQATLGGWLLKLETIHRQGFGAESYLAVVGGFEFTLGDIGASGVDLGLLLEYLYDERGQQATNAFEDDLFLGARLALNDTQSSEILAGLIIDADGSGRFINLEGERRLGQNWKLSLELRAFSGTEPDDLLFSFRRDDHLRLEISRFF